MNLVLLFAALALSTANSSPLESTFQGISLGDSPAAVEELLETKCAFAERRGLAQPQLPLAAEQETHVICREHQDLGTGNRTTFFFADGRLAMIEVQAPQVASLVDLDMEYLSFRGTVGPDRAVLVEESEQVAWILPTASMHAHPFLGSSVLSEGTAATASSALLPSELKLGASRDQIRRAVVSQCQQAAERTISPPRLPTKPKEQIQIDCLGFPYAGFPRKVELVFADDQLALVWILTGKAEEDRVRQALISAYGPPADITNDFETFSDGTVTLRKDKAEVLLAPPELAALLLGNGEKPSAETAKTPE